MVAMANERLQVVTWLHLEDREEYGDSYDDGTPIAYSREVWKRIEIKPWSSDPESLTKSVPITDQDARQLLQKDGSLLEEELYTRLGIRNRQPQIGLPKGPYFDQISIEEIHAALHQALTESTDHQDTSQDIHLGDARNDVSITLASRLVGAIRDELKHNLLALERISTEDFVRLVAELLKWMGYDVNHDVMLGEENNVLLAYKRILPIGDLLFVIECTRQKSNQLIRVGDVRRFIANTVQPQRADRGMLITTSNFTYGARMQEEQWRSMLSLHDQNDIKTWIEQYGTWQKSFDGNLWIPSTLAGHLRHHKRRHVLVLGDFSDEGRERLTVIKNAVASRGYQPILLDEIDESPDYDLRQKLVAIASVCRFAIVDDSSRSGHLMEIVELEKIRVTSVILRKRGTNSTYVHQPIGATSKIMKAFPYDQEDLDTDLPPALEWAESTVTSLRAEYSDALVWRGRE